jgi:hypothetical protein
MERRIRPGARVLRIAVLDRIEMNVLNVPSPVLAIADRVLPIPSLPNAALAPAQTAVRNGLPSRESTREAALNQGPTDPEITITVGHCPNRMKVIRQYDDGVDRERMLMPRVPECGA